MLCKDLLQTEALVNIAVTGLKACPQNLELPTASTTVVAIAVAAAAPSGICNNGEVYKGHKYD